MDDVANALTNKQIQDSCTGELTSSTKFAQLSAPKQLAVKKQLKSQVNPIGGCNVLFFCMPPRRVTLDSQSPALSDLGTIMLYAYWLTDGDKISVKYQI